ncbi:MAG TPA: hypothetical protein VFM80_00725 [Gracilimonas sp.]|uniref:hypothetical protein n=1 Tax=Gracilimonas sp. TaxID=1974203 RepID=UPI002D840DF9|nr:hypothetical protein [Gracilimonas sp.]
MDDKNVVREELVEWISKPGNEDLLETLKLMKEAEPAEGDWYDDLTEGEKESVKKGREDHEKGRTLSSREFWDKHG